MNQRKKRNKMKKLETLKFPGINISELLELEPVFPEMKHHLLNLYLPILIIGQITLYYNQTCKPSDIRALESVRTYTKKFLAKSHSLLYVCAAVAIRRTMGIYANENDSNQIHLDFIDLSENPTGKSSTRGGISTALLNPSRLREYRRGLMLKVTGIIQSTPIHYPRKIATDLEWVTYDNLLERLPYSTEEVDFESTLSWMNEQLGSEIEPMLFYEFQTNFDKVPLEKNLHILRIKPNLPEFENKRHPIHELPVWQKLAITQLRNIKKN